MASFKVWVPRDGCPRYHAGVVPSPQHQGSDTDVCRPTDKVSPVIPCETTEWGSKGHERSNPCAPQDRPVTKYFAEPAKPTTPAAVSKSLQVTPMHSKRESYCFM